MQLNKKYTFFLLLLFIFSFIAIDNYSHSYNLEQISNNPNCNYFASEVDLKKNTFQYDSQFSTIWKIKSKSSYKEITINPLYLNSFEEGFECLGKITNFNKKENAIFVGVNEPQVEIYKLLSYLINFLVIFAINKVRFFYLIPLNLVSAYLINTFFGFNYLFNTNYKFYSPYLDLLDAVLISFALIGFVNKKNENNLEIKVNKNIIVCYFIVFISRLIYILESEFQLNNLVEEWFVNYNYGFTRRGLIGTFLYSVLDLFKIDLKILLVLVIISLNFFMFYLIFRILKNKNLSFAELIILFSPAFINYSLFWKSTITIPKEILGLILFLFFLTYQDKLDESNYFISFTILLNISIYSHEVNLWFAYGIILIILIGGNFKKFYKVLLITLISLLIFSFLIIQNYDNFSYVASQLCSGTYENLLPDAECYKSKILSLDINDNLNLTSSLITLNQKYYLLSYLFYFLVASSPLFLYRLNRHDIKFLSFLIIGFIPLFVFTVDWGRWLNIFFSMTYLYFLKYHSPKKINLFKLGVNYYFQIFMLISFSSMWSILQCCATEYTYNYLISLNKYDYPIIFSIFLIVMKILSQKTKYS